MGRFLTLLSLALLTIAEVAAVMWLYENVGPTGTLSVLALDMFFGLLLIRGAVISPDPANRGWKLAGGVIVALPGLVLDLVGLAMWFPPTRSVLDRFLTRNVRSAATRSGLSVITVTGADGTQVTAVVQGDVITGEVVEQPPTQAGSRKPSDSPQPGVIRGEIAPGAGGDGPGAT